jgi:hypothetical protein
MSNLCEKCRHYNGTGACLHESNGISLVTGKPLPTFTTLKRDRENDCGRAGIYFEPIEKRSFFSSILGVLR